MHMSGQFTVDCPIDVARASLTDPAFIVSTLPDVQSWESKDGGAFDVVLRLGVSFIRGTMKLAARVQDESAGAISFSGHGLGVGSSVDADTRIILVQAGNQTEMQWNGEARIGGRLAAVSGGILDQVARKQIVKVIDAVQSRLKERAATEVHQ